MGDCTAARHGTRWAYDKWGCRCPDTVEAVRAYWRRHHRYVPGQSHNAPRSCDPHVDEIAVERACRGEPVTLTIRERGIAVARLLSQGLVTAEIARRLYVSTRTVERYRAGQVKHATPPEKSHPCDTISVRRDEAA